MGLALLFVIWLITLASSWFFFAKTWWMPAGASAAAAGIDRQRQRQPFAPCGDVRKIEPDIQAAAHFLPVAGREPDDIGAQLDRRWVEVGRPARRQASAREAVS